MRVASLTAGLLALSFAPAAQAQAYPFFLDVDICSGQLGNFATRGTQCTAPDMEGVAMVEAGGVLTSCLVDPLGGPGTVYDAAWPQSWTKTNNLVVMDISSWSGVYLTGALAGGGTSGGVLVDQAGLATPVQSQLGAWDGTKVQQQAWDDCVNGINPPMGDTWVFGNYGGVVAPFNPAVNYDGDVNCMDTCAAVGGTAVGARFVCNLWGNAPTEGCDAYNDGMYGNANCGWMVRDGVELTENGNTEDCTYTIGPITTCVTGTCSEPVTFHAIECQCDIP